MCKRLFDKQPRVRQAALRATRYLQDDDENDKLVQGTFVNLNDFCRHSSSIRLAYGAILQLDTIVGVRVDALRTLRVTASSKALIVKRCRDVSDAVRKVAYTIVSHFCLSIFTNNISRSDCRTSEHKVVIDCRTHSIDQRRVDGHQRRCTFDCGDQVAA
jgi:hypothetical protein